MAPQRSSLGSSIPSTTASYYCLLYRGSRFLCHNALHNLSGGWRNGLFNRCCRFQHNCFFHRRCRILNGGLFLTCARFLQCVNSNSLLNWIYSDVADARNDFVYKDRDKVRLNSIL
jgi:hypothetical protein